MSDLEQSKTIKLEVDSETEMLIQKHDYIKVGNKYYISKDRATQLANKLANEQLETTKPALPIDNVSDLLLSKKTLYGQLLAKSDDDLTDTEIELMYQLAMDSDIRKVLRSGLQ